MERVREEDFRNIWRYAEETVTKNGILDYLRTLARFPQMPWYNVLLIRQQCPDAEVLCGIHAWEHYGAVLRTGEEPLRILCPFLHTDGSHAKDLCLGMVHVYDISQVKFSVSAPDFGMIRLSGNLEDALRGNAGLVVMEDRDNEFLRSRAVKSTVNPEERTVYLRTGLTADVRNAEMMKCCARFIVAEHGDAESHEEQDIAGDCLTYLLCRLFSLQDYPLRILPGELFEAKAERKAQFLRGLSDLFFTAVEGISGIKMLSFAATMFFNIFLTEPDRAVVLEQARGALKTVDGILRQDLEKFILDMEGDRYSDEDLRWIFGKRMARELYTYPSVKLKL